MVIIHKEHVAIPVTEMRCGTCFYSDAGTLFMATDDVNSVENMRMCVSLQSGVLLPFYENEVYIPVRIVSMEVE